jgi:quercetin dioxygenase-like cupin family protein
MSYAPSPRPTFVGPTHIPYATVTRHLWGDAFSGEVADWIYVSSDRIHQLVFGLPPGGMFRHSKNYRTVFAADEVYFVLGGVLILVNPETGEVHRARAGETLFFRRDTWHHAVSYGSEPLRVLEIFAPPPSQGTSGAYARTKPYLTTPRYTQDQWLGKWPMQRAIAQRDFTMQLLNEQDVLWRLEGSERPVLVGIWVSTEYLTMGEVRLLPGQRSEVEVHGGDESLYLLEGSLNVRTPENEGQRWFELAPCDGFFVPQGVPHQYYNMTDEPTRLIFGVAPSYLQDAG